MKSVFADTFHFLALLKADDPYHPRAVELHRVRWRKLVTTDCVLLETGDACCEPRDSDWWSVIGNRWARWGAQWACPGRG